jgi:DNA-directed RNA polymerase subunit RPC12/RpoP
MFAIVQYSSTAGFDMTCKHVFTNVTDATCSHCGAENPEISSPPIATSGEVVDMTALPEAKKKPGAGITVGKIALGLLAAWLITRNDPIECPHCYHSHFSPTFGCSNCGFGRLNGRGGRNGYWD